MEAKDIVPGKWYMANGYWSTDSMCKVSGVIKEGRVDYVRIQYEESYYTAFKSVRLEKGSWGVVLKYLKRVPQKTLDKILPIDHPDRNPQDIPDIKDVITQFLNGK